jgi:hypothetical protein
MTGVVVVICLQGVVAILEMNLTTHPGMVGILHINHLRPLSAFPSFIASLSPNLHDRRASPSYVAPPDDYNPEEPKEDDSEQRSVFVSSLAARLTARDLGYFFEDKLGEGTVMDARIVTDRISRRSKG